MIVENRKLFYILPISLVSVFLVVAGAFFVLPKKLLNPAGDQPSLALTSTITPTVLTPTLMPSVDSAIEATPSGTCISVNGMPDSICTPGSIDNRVTQENIASTICKSGYTAKVRPSVSYTNKLKVQQIVEYGYTDTNPKSYEEDHLIPLELGGNPTDPKNLWPEFGDTPNKKDSVENGCKRKVCAGQIVLVEAQKEISTNWRTACGYNIVD
jgi:hypothetical protein